MTDYTFDEMEKWYNNKGQYHCEDGPAYVDHVIGYACWYINGVRHRIDGPAVEVNGDRQNYWFINGKLIVDDVDAWVEENNFSIPFNEPTQMLFLMKFG